MRLRYIVLGRTVNECKHPIAVMPRRPKARKTSRRKLTAEVRTELVGASKMGHSSFKIAEDFGLNPRTVRDNLRRASSRDAGKSRPRGRPRKTNSDFDDALETSARDNPNQTLREFNINVAPTLSRTTTQRRLRERGLRKWLMPNRPQLNKEARKARLDWALAHEHWGYKEWLKVWWSDESDK